MRSLLLHWVCDAIALWVAAAIVPGLGFSGGLVRLLLVAAVFGIVNSVLRPLLTVLTCPLIVLTLGLFTLVINALMLMLTAWLSGFTEYGLTIDGFWAALWGGVIIAIVNFVLGLVVPDRD